MNEEKDAIVNETTFVIFFFLLKLAVKSMYKVLKDFLLEFFYVFLSRAVFFPMLNCDSLAFSFIFTLNVFACILFSI